MNPTVLLALIANLYEQLLTAQQRIADLEQHQQPPAPQQGAGAA